MNRKTFSLISLAILLLAGMPLLADGPAEEEGDHQEIWIKKIHLEDSCEGDDCPKCSQCRSDS